MSEPSHDWQALVEDLPDLVIRVDREFRYRYVNRRWSVETGISRDECLGRTFREIGLPEPLCEIFEAACRRVVATRALQEFEHAYSGPHGVRHFSVRVLPELDAGGDVAAFLAVVRDVTSRVEAESALATSESRFRAFMDHSPGLFWIKDEAGRYVFMSKGCEIRHEIRFEDCRGRTDHELWPADIAKKYRDNDLRVLADGQTQDVVEQFRNPDGSVVHMLCYKFLIRDADGRKFVGGSAVEITERVQAEESLQERDLCLSALLETGEFVMLGMTPDYRLFEWNRAAERIYGYRREEVLGKDYMTRFLPEEARPGVAEEIRLLLAGRPTEAYPNEVLHRDGSRRTLLWNACRLVDARQQVRGLVAVGQDITDRIRADEALRDSEARYRRLLENIRDVVWSVEIDDDPFRGRLTFISEQADSMFGYTREEFERDPGIWARSLHPDDMEAIRDGMRRLAAGAESLHRSFRFRHGRTGEYRWIEDRVTARHDDRGKVTSLFGVARDVTDRIRAEQALRENEERLKLALDASHAGTWSWDVAGNMSTWDQRYHLLYELDPGLKPSFDVWIERVHPDDRARLQTRIGAMLEPGGGDVWNEEFRTIPLSNGNRWMSGIGRVERDESGNAVRFSGLNLDITDRKRAELAAQQAAAETQAIVEAFPDFYFWLDPDGTIRRFYAGARTYVPPEQFLQRRMQDVLPPDVGRRLLECLQSSIAAGGVREADYALDEPDGRHWYDARFVPLAGSETVLVSVRDVTARRRAEEEGRKLQEQLQHAQKLESLGVLAGGIAHDFNNILTAMMGYTDLALAELPAGSTLRSHLESVMTSARRAAELTQQMLAYSGKGQFVVETVNMSSLIQELVPLLQMSVSKKAQVRYQLDPLLPPVVADPAQMRQIVMNLIINASDALDDRNGAITVATEVKTWSSAELAETYLDERLPEGRYVTLVVSDTGQGMDAETRVKIFDPFFTTKAAGRGLGLAAVLGIIRSHRGAIQVQSEPGRGSTIRVLLPIAADSPPAATAWDTAVPDRASHGTVLVVDDEASVRELARAMLERAGFTVLTAADGREAVTMFAADSARIGLVLLDLTMPQMSGEETWLELQRIRPEVRVILSSGYNEQSAVGELAAKSLAGFLHKPYRYRDLLDAVHKAVTPGSGER